ncbi:transporter [Apiospora arundinis]
MKKHQDAQIAARYTSAMDHDAKVQKKENGGQTATTSSFGSEGGGNIDVAAQYAHRFADSGDTYSPKEEQRLRWKLDLRLVPLLWFNVTLGAMDKVTTATAALYNFCQDTGLDGDKYSWVGSAFYKLPLAKVLCVVQLLWGCVLIATGFANNFAGLIALRVILGALEAPIVPGNFLVLGMWYTRAEQPLHTGLMYTGLSVCFTGPICWGIGFIQDDYQWRAMFWITGAMTVLWAFIIGIFLPDSPVKAKFVEPREKAIAIERLRADQTGIENKRFSRSQMIESFTDPKTWLMCLFHLTISIPNGGLTNFAPLVIKGLGYTSQRSTLLMMPTGVIQTVASYLCNGGVFLCLKYFPNHHTRVAWVLLGILVGLVSTVFLYILALDDYSGRLAALYMSYFYLGPYIVSLGLNTANTAGHTKKVTTNALIFISYCISNIVAPQFFLSGQAPVYALGITAILGSYVLSAISIVLYAAYCICENRRRERVDTVAEGRVHVDTDFKDLTDKENVHFRYVW